MTISRWIKNPERLTYSRFSKTRIISESIRSLIQNDPLVTLSQLQESIESTFAFKVSKELLRTIRKKQGFSRKKVKFFNKPSTMQEKLESFLSERDKLVSKGYQFVSLDETSFGRNVGNVYGYSPKGEQLQELLQDDEYRRIIRKGDKCTSFFVFQKIDERKKNDIKTI